MTQNPVSSQYTRWIYPVPVEDMRQAIAERRYIEIGDPGLNWPAFWPHKRALPKNLNILIAGCGTNQGAYYACRFPDAHITAVDLSDTSLAHEQKLKEKHSLDNLSLHRMDLNDIPELGDSYDFIVSTGVLHHLPDPLEGFKTLLKVLRPEGVLNCMVYGTSLRLGVYMMQELFRMCGLEQTPEDVVLVRDTLASLPEHHVVRAYMANANDLKYDGGLVDTFLHKQDTSFTVPEVFKIARQSGFEFLTWADKGDYSLDSLLKPNHPLWRKLRTLSPEQQAHAHDLLTQSHGTHRFILAHPEYVKTCYIPFDNIQAFLDCTVIFAPWVEIQVPANLNTGQPARITRMRSREFQMGAAMASLMEHMDNGKRPLRQAVADINLSEKLLQQMVKGFHTLWRMGHVFILLPEK